MYELIAKRLPEREAEIMRRMAQAEASHRQRLEARMRELGIDGPVAGHVKISRWARLQARIAPVDRLLAAREAAEDEEVDDLYKRPTGDAATDELLRDIRKEERSHSMAVNEMRSGETATRRRATPSLSPEPAAAPRRGSTRSSAARAGIRPAAAGSAARSTAPTTASPRSSGSSPASPARPPARASC